MASDEVKSFDSRSILELGFDARDGFILPVAYAPLGEKWQLRADFSGAPERLTLEPPKDEPEKMLVDSMVLVTNNRWRGFGFGGGYQLDGNQTNTIRAGVVWSTGGRPEAIMEDKVTVDEASSTEELSDGSKRITTVTTVQKTKEEVEGIKKWVPDAYVVVGGSAVQAHGEETAGDVGVAAHLKPKTSRGSVFGTVDFAWDFFSRNRSLSFEPSGLVVGKVGLKGLVQWEHRPNKNGDPTRFFTAGGSFLIGDDKPSTMYNDLQVFEIYYRYDRRISTPTEPELSETTDINGEMITSGTLSTTTTQVHTVGVGLNLAPKSWRDDHRYIHLMAELGIPNQMIANQPTCSNASGGQVSCGEPETVPGEHLDWRPGGKLEIKFW